MGNEQTKTKTLQTTATAKPKREAAASAVTNKPPTSSSTLVEPTSSSCLLKRFCITDHSVYDDYQIVKPLGEGSTCKVYAVQRKAGTTSTTTTSPTSYSSQHQQHYALKEISKDLVTKHILQEVKNEIEILSQMDHPNILRVYAMYESKRHLYIVMEYCSGGDLTSRYPYSEADVAKIMTKLLSALAYMHDQHKVAHRDIKLENVMFESSHSNAEIKLIDFGLSKQYLSDGRNKEHQRKMTALVGSAYTMAPEVLRKNYTAKADIWSAGVMAYCLLSGTWPFDGSTTKDILYKIHRGDYDKSFSGKQWKHISIDAKSFVSSLMCYDEERRPSAAQALRSSKWLHREFSIAERKPHESVMSGVHNAVIQSTQEGKFKKLAMMVIAYNSSVGEIASLREAFDQYDTNNCGSITYWEFRTALKEKGNFSDEQLKTMFKSLDVNESGYINYSEFLAATLESRGKIVEERITEAFDSLDSDNSGFISRENLRDVVRLQCSEKVTDRLINELMDEVDQNKDGKISYDEFLQVFRSKTTDTVTEAAAALEKTTAAGVISAEDDDSYGMA